MLVSHKHFMSRMRLCLGLLAVLTVGLALWAGNADAKVIYACAQKHGSTPTRQSGVAPGPQVGAVPARRAAPELGRGLSGAPTASTAPAGVDGPTGPSGEAGAAGADRDRGEDGAQGSAGAPANKVLKERSVPPGQLVLRAPKALLGPSARSGWKVQLPRRPRWSSGVCGPGRPGGPDRPTWRNRPARSRRRTRSRRTPR